MDGKSGEKEPHERHSHGSEDNIKKGIPTTFHQKCVMNLEKILKTERTVYTRGLRERWDWEGNVSSGDKSERRTTEFIIKVLQPQIDTGAIGMFGKNGAGSEETRRDEMRWRRRRRRD